MSLENHSYREFNMSTICHYIQAFVTIVESEDKDGGDETGMDGAGSKVSTGRQIDRTIQYPFKEFFKCDLMLYSALITGFRYIWTLYDTAIAFFFNLRSSLISSRHTQYKCSVTKVQIIINTRANIKASLKSTINNFVIVCVDVCI